MYQGKEIFKIPSNLNSIASVLDTPPFQKLQTIPQLGYLINMAVIVTVGIRSQTKLADRLYLFGNTGTNAYPDSSFMVVSETNNREIYDILVSQAETMKANSGKDYSSGFLSGFSTYKNKPQYGLNLTFPDDITNLSKAQVELLFPANFALFNNWLE